MEEHVPRDNDSPNNKRRKMASIAEEDEDTCLIALCSRKRRIGFADPQDFCGFSKPRDERSIGMFRADDTSSDIELNFVGMDVPPYGQKLGSEISLEAWGSKIVDIEASKELFTNKGCTSVLETLFSPAFHSYKEVTVEGSTSCSSTVEQVEVLDDVNSDASCRLEVGCADSNAIILRTCSTDIDQDSFLSASHIDMAHAMFDCHPPMDVGDDCINWIQLEDSSLENQCQMFSLIGDDDPAALFLSIQQSSVLSCNNSSGKDEKSQEDHDDLDDFDPYLFIKRLPDLSEVVACCRPLLLPRQTRRSPPITLVLDLDETLVHSTLEQCDDADFSFPVHLNFQEHTVYVRRRPHLQMFMERVAQMFEIIVFTASQSVYAEQLLNILDPKRKLIRHRVFRDSCVFVDGNYLKDLTVLGRDLSKVAIIDNSPQAFGFQIDNGIPIESWFDDRSDCALAMLLPFLETLVGVDDVRPIIAKKFNLRRKIAAAIEPPSLADRSFLEQPCAKVC